MPPDRTEELLAQIDRKRLLDDLVALIETPSVNPFDAAPSPRAREQEVADLYEAQLQRAGLQTSHQEVLPGRPNVFGKLAGDGGKTSVMLAGHLDTVGVDGYKDPFTPTIKNERVYGRGSCDMKAGLAAFVEVARVLSANRVELNGELWIAGIADEENGMLGSKYIRAHGPRPDFAILGEPTELEICRAHKGQITLPIRTFGKACHSSIPEQGVNAIAHMGEVLQAFGDYNAELGKRKPHAVCGHATFSPGVIRGGDIVSAVPDFCELEVDRRTVPGEDLDSITREFEERLQPLAARHDNFRYEIGAPVMQSDALNTPPDSPVVRAVAQSYARVLSRDAELRVFSGGTDAPNLRCDAVICGPGGISQAHTLDEFVEIEQVVNAARIYLLAVLQLLT